jgi:hypothetical protein
LVVFSFPDDGDTENSSLPARLSWSRPAVVDAARGRGDGAPSVDGVEVLPVVLLLPVAGVTIGRFSCKRVLIGADLFRATLTFVPASVTSTTPP